MSPAACDRCRRCRRMSPRMSPACDARFRLRGQMVVMSCHRPARKLSRKVVHVTGAVPQAL